MTDTMMLPSDEFEILRQDDKVVHLYDKVVDKIYVFDKETMSWSFPKGSRQVMINKLTGVDLFSLGCDEEAK